MPTRSARCLATAFRALALSLAGGLCLMVALRAALADAAWPWIIAPVAAAGIVHALDLRARWPR